MSDNGDRDDRGRFTPGNRASVGRGNPHAARVNELRGALLEAVTPEDVGEVVRALVVQAKSGDLDAIRELLDRVVGRANEGCDLLLRLDQIESLLDVDPGWSLS